MNNQFLQFRKLELLLTPLFPELKLEKKDFTRENSDPVIRHLVFLLDALFKAENQSQKKNFPFPENRELFSQNLLTLIENIILYLQTFNTQIFSLNRNEKQTFIFILENILDYIKISVQPENGEAKTVFSDYKFWIENFFKIIDQKVMGAISPGKESGSSDAQGPLFSNSLISIDLNPFVLQREDRFFWLVNISEDELLYIHPQSGEQQNLQSPDVIQKLGCFLVANLAFGQINRIQEPFQKLSPNLHSLTGTLQKALHHHMQKLYEESFLLLNNIGLDDLRLPLPYLLQTKNLIGLGRDHEAKRLIQKFLLYFPHYAEGYEIMGDLYQKEENWELTLGFYEKATLINHNKNLSEKIKKVRENIEKSKTKADTQKSDLFYNISETILQSEEKLIPRDREIKQMVEILISPNKRNVMLIGDKGVGKTALIRLLAQKMVFEEVPEGLKEKKIKEINFVSLLTGSKYRGQFEEKTLKMFQDFRSQNSILVLEDIHLMVSSGAARGTSLDLVNILKGFLKENSFQVIATTDYEEFKNSLEKDTSLMGFFQKLTVNEMNSEETFRILKNTAASLAVQSHFHLPQNLLQDIVDSAKRDIRERKLPDAAIMLLERSVAKVKLKHHVDPTLPLTLTETDLKETLADFLNLPESNISLSWKKRLFSLKENIQKRIMGQEKAIESVISSIITSKLGLDVKKNRPKGVFLFIGPTGVGKTETALAITEALYGTQDYLIRIDMSEYMERFTYSRFVGAAPGYVGYYDSNQLTDKVRQNPFSVILLDEIEKADSQLLNIFLQVFDAGRLTDARGNVVDFSNSTIIMTSNIGTSLFSKAAMGYQGSLDGGSVSRNTLMKALKRHFSPEFLNRIDEIVVFRHLSAEDIRNIIQIHLQEIRKDLEKQGKEFLVKDEAVDFIVRCGYSLEYGARNLARTLKKELLEKIASLSLGKEWDEIRLLTCQLADNEIEIACEPPQPLKDESMIAQEAQK